MPDLTASVLGFCLVYTGVLLIVCVLGIGFIVANHDNWLDQSLPNLADELKIL